MKKHKDSLIPVWLPTASPEFMVLEESWNISKKDLLVLTYYYYYHSFTNFRKEIGGWIFQNKTFQPEYEKLSGWKEELENLC